MLSVSNYELVGQIRREKNNNRKKKVYAAALLLSAAHTLPFIGIVQTLSSNHPERFQPCSFQACTLWGSITNFDGQHPSTIKWGHYSNIFHMVRNGDAGLKPPADGYMPPLCPGNTSASMRELCHTRSVRAGIVNGMVNSYCKFMYLGFCGSWFGTKVLHDWGLLYGWAERDTIRIGMLSWVFEALGAAAAFLWCHLASGVFISPIAGGPCACYYTLSDLECILAISTPMYLLIRSIFKLEKILRSTMFGDFLYSTTYDVPFYIVDESLQQPMDPYIVASTHGAMQSVRDPKRILGTNDIAWCLQCHRWVLQPLRVAMVSIISIALFPISVRFLSLLHVQYQEFWREGVVAAIIVPATGTYVRAEMANLIDFDTCRWSARFRHKKGFEAWKAQFLHSTRSLAVSFAAALILGVLFHSAYSTSELTPWDVLLWSLSFAICMFNFVSETFAWRVRCVVRAMKMKTGTFRVPVAEYIQMTNDYPEFGLDDEKDLAQEAVQGSITRDEWSNFQQSIPTKISSRSSIRSTVRSLSLPPKFSEP